MPSEGKNPKGGLTPAGREFFARRDGSHLKPGVTGAADTPEKQKRKGSFLVRMFTHPRGPMVKDGEPTRLALSAHAWGEPVPKTDAQAHKLAAKGRKLLEKYHSDKSNSKAPGGQKSKKSGVRAGASKKASGVTAKKAAGASAKKAAPARTKSAVKKSSAKAG